MPAHPTVAGRSTPRPRTLEPVIQARSDRVKLRRGLTFLAMTLLLPGSAQIAAGHRRIGWAALRIWAALVLVVLAFAVTALAWRSGAVHLASLPAVLWAVQIGLVVVGVGWGLLLLDAWRIARPPELARRHRLGFGILNLGLVFFVSGGLIASASMVSAQRDFVTTVFAGGGDGGIKDGRYNILLLGGDAGSDRIGLRPDSLTVASIDARTGRTVLFSLPRNLEGAPFPSTSPMHRVFPHGYRCADHSCMLNAVYTYATDHARALYPGVKRPGVQATKEAVEGVTGLPINYYALIDLKGFQRLIDAVGGITLDVNKPIPIGGGSTVVKSYIEPGKNQHLDGYHALWFARSRHGDSDYERMARQKCVMNAMLKQLNPVTVLTSFNRIAAAGKHIVATDIPASDVNTFLELALKARRLPVASVAFVPPMIQPGAANFDLIRSTVSAKIAAAEATHARKASGASPTARPSVHQTASRPSAGAGGAASTAPRAADTNDLGQVCSSS